MATVIGHGFKLVICGQETWHRLTMADAAVLRYILVYNSSRKLRSKYALHIVVRPKIWLYLYFNIFSSEVDTWHV
jgi:hypothetical protein